MDNENEKLPFSEGAERAILGKILNYSDIFGVIASEIAVKDFYFQNHRYIFSAMRDLDAESVEINISSLSNRLAELGKLEKSGGRTYLEDLILQSPSGTEIQSFIDLIRSTSVRRQLSKGADEIKNLSLNPAGLNADEIIDRAEEKIFSIGNSYREAKKDGTTSVQDFTAQTLDYMDTIKKLIEEQGEDALIGYSTGLTELNNYTLGLQKGDLIIIAARPSMGKTALAMNIAWEVSSQSKLPALIFSLEMPGQSLTMRLISSLSQIHQKILKKGVVTDISKFRSALTKIKQCKMFINDKAGISINEITAECRKLKKEHGDLGIIVVDYLQLIPLEGEKFNSNRAALIGDLSRRFKLLARELDVPIIVLSQLNRSVDSRPNKKPIMSDLRESGAIEQDADLILFIYRSYPYTHKLEEINKAEIIVSKNRNGEIGDFPVFFDGNISLFKDAVNLTYNEDSENDEGDEGYFETKS